MKYLYVKPVFLWLSAVSVMFLGACTNEIPDTPEATEAISFSVPQTRAAIESVNDMSAFSVWGWYDVDATPFAVFENTTVEKTAEGWSYTDYVRYWSPGKTYDFYAVHPVGLNQVSCTDKGVLRIPDFDCSTASDLMIASKTNLSAENGAAQGVQLTFSHLLARIEVTAKRHNAAADIAGFNPRVISAKVYGMYKKADFEANINEVIDATSAWTVKGEPTASDSPLVDILQPTDISSTQDTPLLDILLFPQLIQRDYYLEIIYSTDGGVSTKPAQKIQLATLPITQWEAGKRYHYSFTISADDRILFDKPTVTEWDEAVGGIIIVD